MGVDSEDRTGQLPSVQDVEDARTIVRKHLVNMKWMMANVELGVQLGNIDRCLKVAEIVIRDAQKKGLTR